MVRINCCIPQKQAPASADSESLGATLYNDHTLVKVLCRISQDRQIIEHSRTNLYSYQQDHKQVSNGIK